MLQIRKNGQTSNIIRCKILDSSKTDGSGLTGLSTASSGLIISTICDNESSPTTYTVGSTLVDAITTLGTFSAPTSGHCRFKEIDSTNHKGVYELQIEDSRFSVSGAKTLLVSLSGATNLAQCDFIVQLTATDLQDSARFGLTSLSTATFGSSGGLPQSVDGSGRVDVLKINGTSQTARDIGASVLLSSGTGTGQVTLSSGAVQSYLTATAQSSMADAILDRDMSVGTDSGSTSVRTPRQAMRFLRNKFAISAGTLTVYKEDDATASWTGSVTASSAAFSVTGNDPTGP